MRTRKTLTPVDGPQAGQEKRKNKRARHICSPANCMEKKREYIPSNKDLEAPLGKVLGCPARTTELVLTENCKEYVVPLDENQTGGFASQTVEGQTGNMVKKKLKMKKWHVACDNGPSQRLLKEHSPCNRHTSIKSVVETTGMDSMIENLEETFISNNLMSLGRAKVGVSEIADADSVEKCNMGDERNAHSSEVKRTTRKAKSKSSKFSVKEDVTNISMQVVQNHSSADSPSLSNIVDIDSVRMNNCEGSITISDNVMPLVEKKSTCLAKNVNAASIQNNILHGIYPNSQEMKSTCSVKTIMANSTSANRSSSSEIAEVDLVKNNHSVASVSDNLTLLTKDEAICLSKIVDADKVMKSDMSSEVNSVFDQVKNSNSKPHKKHRRKGTIKPSDTIAMTCCSLPVVLNFTSSSSSTLSANPETELVRETSIEASHSPNLMALVEKESSALTEGACADSINKRGMPLEINSNSNAVKITDSNVCKKAKRKRKGKLFDFSFYNLELDQDDPSANSSSLLENTEMKLVGKNNADASDSNNLMPIIDIVNKSDTSLEINSNSNIVETTNSNVHKKTKKMKLVGKNNVDGSVRNSLIPIIALADSSLTKSVDANSPIRSNIRPEILSNSYEADNSGSVQTNDKEKEANKSSDHTVKQVQEDERNTSLQVVEYGDAISSDKVPASRKVKRRTRKKVKHTLHEGASNDAFLQKNGGSLDEFQKAPQDYAISSGDLKVCSTDRKEEVSLPASPIRGIIDDLSPSDLPNESKNLSGSFKEEDIIFSFHIIDDALMERSSVNHSEKASPSRSEVGSKNVKPPIHKDNISDSMSTFPRQVEKKKLSESQKSHVLTEVSTGCKEEKEVPSSSMSYAMEDIFSLDVPNKRNKESGAVLVSPERAFISCARKKLLVLDLNGLLADVIFDLHNVHKANKKVGWKSVFKRPFCDDFLKFCFERFDIGVWSSRGKNNVDNMVDFLMGDIKHRLLFCWDQSKCTATGYTTVENAHKPLVLKELKKLWNKEKSDLPWKKGEYSPSNTLLVDDSPYKALCNPPHTGIFPYPYHFSDKNDNSLGPTGDLRVYLEGLSMTDNVQHYVQEHPFGQRAITATNPSWKFYHSVIDKIENSSPTR